MKTLQIKHLVELAIKLGARHRSLLKDLVEEIDLSLNEWDDIVIGLNEELRRRRRAHTEVGLIQ